MTAAGHASGGARHARAALLAAGALLALLPPAGAEEPDCGDCHEVDVAALEASPHAFLGCADCHVGAGELPHAEGVAEPDCTLCHADVFAELTAGPHGGERGAEPAGAEACSACHGPVHALRPHDSPDSPLHVTRVAETCGGCHADPDMAHRFDPRRVRPIEAYRGGVHARAVVEGKDAPSCSGCHGSHAILPASDPASPVHPRRVAQTCGHCHGAIAEAYAASVHGRAVADGVREAPTCTDCHGEHRILSPRDLDSPVHASGIPKLTCGRCHGDLRLAEKFSLPADRVPAFQDSFHGLALRAGGTTVAHCGSCHGVHEVLPSSDPRSSVHPANLPGTCGQCHPGAGASFPIGEVHVVPQASEHVVVRWVRLVYLWLIGLTVGGMLLHNGLDFWRKLRASPLPPAPPVPRAPERMGAGFRTAHLLLIASFAALVYSGFALQYPEAAWARPLQRWHGGTSLRASVHRISALVLMGTLAFHVLHLLRSRRARACIAGMRPRRRDLRELRERLAWLLGRRAEPPRSAALGYPEKLEYLALMWGIAVMSVTGFALWFNDWVLRWLPKWVSDLATTVHWYEAILATLAILVWHLYFVIFDPVVYPMDKAWLTGRSHPGREREREPKPPPDAD